MLGSRTKSNLLSTGMHISVAALLFTATTNREIRRGAGRAVSLVGPRIAPYVPLAKSPAGGGGGVRDFLPASKGQLPRLAPRQFTPPLAVVNNDAPKLVVEPTLVIQSAITLPAINVSQLGDPGGVSGPLSGGPGSGGGIGSGRQGGVGPGSGPGYGPGDGGTVAGNFTGRVSGNVSPAALLWKVEPEYSDEARRAKLQGTVLLVIEVDAIGRARNARVQQGLGLGLDEKAVEAVYKWKFRPSYRDGKPVPSPALIEINFRLL